MANCSVCVYARASPPSVYPFSLGQGFGSYCYSSSSFWSDQITPSSPLALWPGVRERTSSDIVRPSRRQTNTCFYLITPGYGYWMTSLLSCLSSVFLFRGNFLTRGPVTPLYLRQPGFISFILITYISTQIFHYHN